MKIYMDCCCYNRPFDDLNQERIKIESEAIMAIINRSRAGESEIIGSEILDLEIDQIRDPEKRKNVEALHEVVDSCIQLNDKIDQRAAEIQNQSKIHTFDSFHIAFAEAAKADVMLTTDDKLEKMASRLQLKVTVMNPLKFVMQYMYGGD
ncbi:MAG: PIN domain-containing protein [Lachnospiraceae bacterium]|nr:PIN domain-containing protein [Lachnospiraceae bacterium]